MEEEAYTAKFLVDEVLKGHFLINEEIDQTVRRVCEKYGDVGRDRMYAMKPLRHYATDEEVAAWQEELLAVEAEFEREARRQEQLRQDKYQQRFPWS